MDRGYPQKQWSSIVQYDPTDDEANVKMTWLTDADIDKMLSNVDTRLFDTIYEFILTISPTAYIGTISLGRNKSYDQINITIGKQKCLVWLYIDKIRVIYNEIDRGHIDLYDEDIAINDPDFLDKLRDKLVSYSLDQPNHESPAFG